MGKCLMLAVAGSGKTTHLINKLNLEQRFLIVTYTRNNHEHLRHSVLKRFGFFPENIKILKYFPFLYSFCYKPFCGLDKKARGICFKMPPEQSRFQRGQDAFYKTEAGRLYSNRMAHFCREHCVDDIKERLDKYYDHFFIDEVQDIAGHDFNLLLSIIPDRCDTLFVGDFFQHTYDTSKDGNVNINLYNDYMKFLNKWKVAGVSVDTDTLARTHRCNEEICSFVKTLGIAIESTGEVQGHVYVLENQEDVDEVVSNDRIPKLFFENSSRYRCASMNWGASKGIDNFVDVCVVLNQKSQGFFEKGKLADLPPMSKNKLYVASTRAHRHLYVTSYSFLEKYKIV